MATWLSVGMALWVGAAFGLDFARCHCGITSIHRTPVAASFRIAGILVLGILFGCNAIRYLIGESPNVLYLARGPGLAFFGWFQFQNPIFARRFARLPGSEWAHIDPSGPVAESSRFFHQWAVGMLLGVVLYLLGQAPPREIAVGTGASLVAAAIAIRREKSGRSGVDLRIYAQVGAAALLLAVGIATVLERATDGSIDVTRTVLVIATGMMVVGGIGVYGTRRRTRHDPE